MDAVQFRSIASKFQQTYLDPVREVRARGVEDNARRKRAKWEVIAVRYPAPDSNEDYSVREDAPKVLANILDLELDLVRNVENREPLGSDDGCRKQECGVGGCC
jgi:hypothetical protein